MTHTRHHSGEGDALGHQKGVLHLPETVQRDCGKAVTEMIADDTSGPMDLVNISAQDSKSSFGDDELHHGVSYGDTCAIAGVCTTLAEVLERMSRSRQLESKWKNADA